MVESKLKAKTVYLDTAVLDALTHPKRKPPRDIERRIATGQWIPAVSILQLLESWEHKDSVVLERRLSYLTARPTRWLTSFTLLPILELDHFAQVATHRFPERGYARGFSGAFATSYRGKNFEGLEAFEAADLIKSRKAVKKDNLAKLFDEINRAQDRLAVVYSGFARNIKAGVDRLDFGSFIQGIVHDTFCCVPEQAGKIANLRQQAVPRHFHFLWAEFCLLNRLLAVKEKVSKSDVRDISHMAYVAYVDLLFADTPRCNEAERSNLPDEWKQRLRPNP
ncbi:hypothetical protein ACFL6C_08825 [Myxococcota bacterium]